MGRVGQGDDMKGSAGFLIHLWVRAMLAVQASVNVGYKNDFIQLFRTFLDIVIGSHRDEYLVRSVVFWHYSYIGSIMS